MLGENKASFIVSEFFIVLCLFVIVRETRCFKLIDKVTW